MKKNEDNGALSTICSRDDDDDDDDGHDAAGCSIKKNYYSRMRVYVSFVPVLLLHYSMKEFCFVVLLVCNFSENLTKRIVPY